jgi:hypothetical protein
MKSLLLVLVILATLALSADPDEFLNVSQLIISKGYRVEDHSVITQDG